MKFIWILAMVLVLPAFTAFPADSIPGNGQGWLIDAARRHASVHRDLSCTDCHEDIGTTEHPDAGDVNRAPGYFFNPVRCEGCHESSEDILIHGEHGGRIVTDIDQIKNCIGCHDPHYRIASSDKGAFDPSRPVRNQCGACHESESRLPDPNETDRECLSCHEYFWEKDRAPAQINRLCLSCHDRAESESVKIIRVDAGQLADSPHRGLTCLECHVHAARFPHNGQSRRACLECHQRHDEKKAHSLHMSVTCEACHLEGAVPVRDKATGMVVRRAAIEPGDPDIGHTLTDTGRDQACRSCHRPGNTIGAAAAILPPKSLLCLPCHPATLSIGDPITIAALVAMLLGIILMAWPMFSGPRTDLKTNRPAEGKGVNPGGVIKALFYDVLSQRRLWRRSRKRWAIHALIFYGMLFRLLWGLIGLALSLTRPEWDTPWRLLDTNAAWTAFLFDLTGLMILAGVVLTMIRRGRSKSPAQPEGLPVADWPALTLLALSVLTGFAAEGMRMAMTGAPPSSGHAFAGYVISFMMPDAGSLTAWYPYIWYIHAGVIGGLAAYLPFSKLRHMILAPLVFIINASEKRKGGAEHN